MTQSTILAAGTTAATSSDVVIAAGAVVTVGIFASSGAIPDGVVCSILQDTPGADVLLHDRLDANNPSTQITGPGTFRIARPVTSVSIGAFSEV
jgi:hypothetical protein